MEKDNRELFRGVAWHYARHRLGYPQELFEELVRAFQLDTTGSVLDVGCGTGQLAITLAPYVHEVVGLDVENDMLKEATKQAEDKGVHNIRWVHIRAEDISQALGEFRLTTMGASFHWMEQAVVLQNIFDVTEKGGGVAVVSNEGCSVWSDRQDEPWKETRKKMIQKYLGERRRAGTGFYQEPEKRFEDLLAESSFSNAVTWTHAWSYQWDIPSIIGNLYSTSFASQKLFGDHLISFEKELTEELLTLNPDGRFIDNIRTEALMAWKK